MAWFSCFCVEIWHDVIQESGRLVCVEHVEEGWQKRKLRPLIRWQRRFVVLCFKGVSTVVSTKMLSHWPSRNIKSWEHHFPGTSHLRNSKRRHSPSTSPPIPAASNSNQGTSQWSTHTSPKPLLPPSPLPPDPTRVKKFWLGPIIIFLFKAIIIIPVSYSLITKSIKSHSLIFLTKTFTSHLAATLWNIKLLLCFTFVSLLQWVR